MKAPQIDWRLLAFFAFALCIGAYMNGLFGSFMFDDRPNIIENSEIRNVGDNIESWQQAALSSHAGPLKRPVSMLSFAANYYFSGFNPAAFKATNLLIHLICGILILLLCRLILPQLLPSRTSKRTSDSLALFICACWLLHPLSVSNVLYVVQRMNLLATLFTLTGLVCYAWGRQRMFAGQRHGMIVGIGGLLFFGALATLSKENGALIIAYAAVIELWCFRLQGTTLLERRGLAVFFAFTLLLPAILILGYLAITPEWFEAAYANRQFNVFERVLTQCRILFHYLCWIIAPLPASLGIYHDDIPISSGLFDPMSTAASLAGVITLVAASGLTWRKVPTVSFAIAWFFAGHAMESSIVPLEMVFEHRNYLPMLGIILLAARLIFLLPNNLKNLPLRPGVCTIIIALLASGTAYRSYIWGDPLRLARKTAEHHPQSSRSLHEAGRAIIFEAAADNEFANARLTARPYFRRAMAANTHDIFSAASYLLTYSGQLEVPDAAIKEMASRQARELRGFSAPTKNLLEASSSGRLALTLSQAQALAEAALSNPSVNKTDRALILSEFGAYQFNIQKDPQAAVNLAMAAVNEQPGHPLLRLNLANLAITLDRLDIARSSIESARQLDARRHYREQILDLEERISNAEHSQTQPTSSYTE